MCLIQLGESIFEVARTDKNYNAPSVFKDTFHIKLWIFVRFIRVLRFWIWNQKSLNPIVERFFILIEANQYWMHYCLSTYELLKRHWSQNFVSINLVSMQPNKYWKNISSFHLIAILIWWDLMIQDKKVISQNE